MYAQPNCAEPKVESYRKVMNSAFASEYQKCPVIIVAQFVSDDFPNYYFKPSKLKKMFFFQCVNADDSGKETLFSDGRKGDFFVIDKAKADKVLSLKKGDKIKITGKTFVHNYLGTVLGVYFIVDDLEKIND
ncbi:MAG: hypothetical protein NZ516_04975 [Raineya sp.]|nr:hypothetical protein [Raineya sp.]